jgi:uncharacterized damage-inducible protein DinB
MTGADELGEMLRVSRQALLNAASGISPERAARRPADGEWSVLEVLAHLVDVDYHWATQALAMRDNPQHMFVGFDDDAWKNEHADIRETPLTVVLALLNESHASVLFHLASMGDADLNAPGLHPRAIPYTVRDVFLRYPAHDENHTRQIREILDSI